MNKLTFCSNISIVAVFLVSMFFVCACNDVGIHKADVITKEETALKIGRALLEEYANTYWGRPLDKELAAEENNGLWSGLAMIY